MSCVVRNISPEGAAIDVDNPAFVPARFRLVMANGATVHECSVAWIQKNRIGLTFIAGPPQIADRNDAVPVPRQRTTQARNDASSASTRKSGGNVSQLLSVQKLVLRMAHLGSMGMRL